MWVLAGALAACSPQDPVRVSADEVTEVALKNVPGSVMRIVLTARPGFQPKEVQKKIRDARVYYDVEGELPNGEEIEFDVLMTDTGPQIVEVQRDINWTEVPQGVQTVVNDANLNSLDIARVIESVQTDKAIIYEVFAVGYPSDPKFEVWTKDDAIKLLPTRWKH